MMKIEKLKKLKCASDEHLRVCRPRVFTLILELDYLTYQLQYRNFTLTHSTMSISILISLNYLLTFDRKNVE